MSELPDIPEVPNPFTNAKITGENIDPAVYHKQLPGIERGHKDFVMSRSELVLFASNNNRWINGYTPAESDAKDNGSMIDTYLLDRPRFNKQYILTPETCTATKLCKAVKEGKYREGEQMPWNNQLGECKEWKAQKEEEGFTVISRDQMQDCVDAEKRIMDDPILGEFIDCSKKSVMIHAEFNDKKTGLIIPCKFLLDLVPDKNHPKFGKDIGDLKTSRDGAPRGWAKMVNKYFYHWQGSMFRHAYVAATGEDRTDFAHVVQENVFPFQPGRRKISAWWLNFAALYYTAALRDYAQCLASGVWPSWDDNPITTVNGWTVVEPEPWMINQV